MLAELGDDLDLQGTIVAPRELANDDRTFDGETFGNGSRVQGQAQTFGEDIEANQTRNAADGTTQSLFIGLEGHRDYDIDTSKLPTPEELQALGIDKVVYLTESAVGQDTGRIPEDVQQYVQQLQNSGLELDVRGVDPRQGGQGVSPNPFDSLVIPPELIQSYQVEDTPTISAQVVEDVRTQQTAQYLS